MKIPSIHKRNRTSRSSAVIYTGPVNDIQRFDMPQVYHHLREGRKVRLAQEWAADGSPQVAVYFRYFKLGHLPVAYGTVVEQLLQRGFFLHATITQVIRQKYLPAEVLEIQITDQIS